MPYPRICRTLPNNIPLRLQLEIRVSLVPSSIFIFHDYDRFPILATKNQHSVNVFATSCWGLVFISSSFLESVFILLKTSQSCLWQLAVTAPLIYLNYCARSYILIYHSISELKLLLTFARVVCIYLFGVVKEYIYIHAMFICGFLFGDSRLSLPLSKYVCLYYVCA